MAEVDREAVVAWLARWWVEAVLVPLALVGLVTGLDGDRLRLVLGLGLGLAVLDRLRLRLDNRSLAAAVEEIRDGRVSAARRVEEPTGTGPDRGRDEEREETTEPSADPTG
jgi:hypothetical protein